MCTISGIIVLPHCETRPLATLPGIPQSHYPYTVKISPCQILLMPSNKTARLASGKYQFYKSLVWLDHEPNTQSLARESRTLPIRPPRPVYVQYNYYASINRKGYYYLLHIVLIYRAWYCYNMQLSKVQILLANDRQGARGCELTKAHHGQLVPLPVRPLHL